MNEKIIENMVNASVNLVERLNSEFNHDISSIVYINYDKSHSSYMVEIVAFNISYYFTYDFDITNDISVYDVTNDITILTAPLDSDTDEIINALYYYVLFNHTIDSTKCGKIAYTSIN